jgi:putative FmdB family regulatory protein
MPTYEYECSKCHKTFEVEQKISDPILKTCPEKECEGEVKRLISGSSSFVLKGSGWSKNGY